jgi:haloacid dehalogenase-like hydrolase
MYYQAFATDYDGTLATDGQVDEPTLAALQALRASGRRLVLVSGREHADLLHGCPVQICWTECTVLILIVFGRWRRLPDTKTEQHRAAPE